MSYAAARRLSWPDHEEYRRFDWMNAYDAEGEPRYLYWQADRLTDPDSGRITTWTFDSLSGMWARYSSRGKQLEIVDHTPDEAKAEGPMAGGFWPLAEDLPDDPDENDVAWALRGLQTCLVKVDDVYGVALTGIGGNYAWQLAYSAVLLGFLPWSNLYFGSGGPGNEAWRFGVSQIGHGPAARVRAALRHRERNTIRRARAALDTLNEWK